MFSAVVRTNNIVSNVPLRPGLIERANDIVYHVNPSTPTAYPLVARTITIAPTVPQKGLWALQGVLI